MLVACDFIPGIKGKEARQSGNNCYHETQLILKLLGRRFLWII